MAEKIYDGDDIAHDRGYKDFETFLKAFPEQTRRMFRANLKAWNGKTCGGPSIAAHINGGRWSATCWCGNSSYVTPRNPIHFCMKCGNQAQDGYAVPVIFPDEATRAEIERLLLARPVQPGLSEFETQAAYEAQALIPGLRRDWYPGQTVEFLEQQNKDNGL